MEEFRILTEQDAAAYYTVLHEGYADNKQFLISFSAADMTEEQTTQWILDHPVYGLFVDDELVCSITLRMPWGSNPGSKRVPHIGHFVTAPQHKHKGYAKRLLAWTEDTVLRGQLKAPSVTLGTADSHPWLKYMYEAMGFVCYDTIQLRGKLHKTLLFEKSL